MLSHFSYVVLHVSGLLLCFNYSFTGWINNPEILCCLSLFPCYHAGKYSLTGVDSLRLTIIQLTYREKPDLYRFVFPHWCWLTLPHNNAAELLWETCFVPNLFIRKTSWPWSDFNVSSSRDIILPVTLIETKKKWSCVTASTWHFHTDTVFWNLLSFVLNSSNHTD